MSKNFRASKSLDDLDHAATIFHWLCQSKDNMQRYGMQSFCAFSRLDFGQGDGKPAQLAGDVLNAA